MYRHLDSLKFELFERKRIDLLIIGSDSADTKFVSR